MKDNKKIKIVTYIDRINILSEIFIKFYLKFFKSEEFYFLILDVNYQDITNYLTSKNFPTSCFEMVSNDYIGEPTLLSRQNSIVDELISDDFIVVYVDIDEILYHENLREYILNSEKIFVSPTGVVIVPNINESNIINNENILTQRKNCVIDNEFHSKICILKSKYVWSGGRHNKNNNEISEDIFLIDISKCCPKIMLENNLISNQLYQNKTNRYSVTSEGEIQNILNDWRKFLQIIPEHILKTNLF